MSGEAVKGVVLYNHATGTGHHESWTAMFAALLLKRGYRVACLTPDPAALEAVLRGQGIAGHINLHLLPIPAPMSYPPTWWRIKKALYRCVGRQLPEQGAVPSCAGLTPEKGKPTLRDRWRLNAYRYVANAPEVKATHGLPWRVVVKRRLLHLFVPPVWWVQQRARGVLHAVVPPTPRTGTRDPVNLVAAANFALKNLPWRPDILLSMYADLWLTAPSLWRRSATRMPMPWAGVRFMPLEGEQVGREGYFRDRAFRGLCFLDEKADALYRTRIPAKTFQVLPDVANGDLPDQRVELAEKMRSRADGRPIIILCGSIEGRKNIKLFCETALRPGAEKYFFAIIGQLQHSSILEEEAALLENFSRSSIGNTLFANVFFDDERELNAVIQAADIVFAVYRNFSISSNMPGKAAQFRKPILVSGRYLLGQRVARYGIGYGMEEDDADAMLAGISHAVARPVPEECFARYCADFSSAELARRLDSFLQNCLR